MSELIRVLIADNHFVVRQGLATLLVARNGMQVVGEAATGARRSNWRAHSGPT